MSVERLWKPGFRVYLWTFTFREVVSDWDGMRAWTLFMDHLKKSYKDFPFSGVRVVELHKEHGVHFHAVINRRLSVNMVRRIARRYGFGRIHVCVAQEGAARYLGKYLSKCVDGPVSKSGNSLRRWACFGADRGVRVRDLENIDPYWVYRREQGLYWLGFRLEHVLRGCWLFGEGVLKSAWFAAKSGFLGDLYGLAEGRLVWRGPGEFVERPVWAVQPF